MKKTRVYGYADYYVTVKKYCIPGYDDNNTSSVVVKEINDKWSFNFSDWLPEGINWREEEKIKAWLKERIELDTIKLYNRFTTRPLGKMKDSNRYKPVGIYGIPKITKVEIYRMNHYFKEVAE